MNKTLSNKLLLLLLLLPLLALLGGCGGGGGGGSKVPLPPSGSSNWDQMVWDQDDWA